MGYPIWEDFGEIPIWIPDMGLKLPDQADLVPSVGRALGRLRNLYVSKKLLVIVHNVSGCRWTGTFVFFPGAILPPLVAETGVVDQKSPQCCYYYYDPLVDSNSKHLLSNDLGVPFFLDYAKSYYDHHNLPPKVREKKKGITWCHPFGSDLNWKNATVKGIQGFPQLFLESADLPIQTDTHCCGFGVYTAAIYFMNFIVEQPQEFANLFIREKVCLQGSEGEGTYLIFPGEKLQQQELPNSYYLDGIRREFFVLCDRVARHIHVDFPCSSRKIAQGNWKPSIYYTRALEMGFTPSPLVLKKVRETLRKQASDAEERHEAALLLANLDVVESPKKEDIEFTQTCCALGKCRNKSLGRIHRESNPVLCSICNKLCHNETCLHDRMEICLWCVKCASQEMCKYPNHPFDDNDESTKSVVCKMCDHRLHIACQTQGAGNPGEYYCLICSRKDPGVNPKCCAGEHCLFEGHEKSRAKNLLRNEAFLCQTCKKYGHNSGCVIVTEDDGTSLCLSCQSLRPDEPETSPQTLEEKAPKKARKVTKLKKSRTSPRTKKSLPRALPRARKVLPEDEETEEEETQANVTPIARWTSPRRKQKKESRRKW